MHPTVIRPDEDETNQGLVSHRHRKNVRPQPRRWATGCRRVASGDERLKPLLASCRCSIHTTFHFYCCTVTMSPTPEFTAVILAATTGARLFPMTSTETPKHLLPIAGVPLIVRLLHSVAASGFAQCIVALASSDSTTMTLLKQEVGDGDWFQTKMKVTLYSLSDDCAGSVEALRQVNDVVSPNSNLVVLPGDLVMMETSVLTQLVNAHRQSNLPPNNMSTACTMLLADVGEQDENGVPLKESSKV